MLLFFISIFRSKLMRRAPDPQECETHCNRKHTEILSNIYGKSSWLQGVLFLLSAGFVVCKAIGLSWRLFAILSFPLPPVVFLLFFFPACFFCNGSTNSACPSICKKVKPGHTAHEGWYLFKPMKPSHITFPQLLLTLNSFLNFT